MPERVVLSSNTKFSPHLAMKAGATAGRTGAGMARGGKAGTTVRMNGVARGRGAGAKRGRAIGTTFKSCSQRLMTVKYTGAGTGRAGAAKRGRATGTICGLRTSIENEMETYRSRHRERSSRYDGSRNWESSRENGSRDRDWSCCDNWGWDRNL